MLIGLKRLQLRAPSTKRYHQVAGTSSHHFKNQYEFNLFQSDPGINSDQQQRKALYIFLSENGFLSYKLTSIKSKPNADMECTIRIKCLISTS